MNIKEAKEQIKYAISAYLTKNEIGEYRIPIQSQRPVFVMGAPGIGKTDIMKQIAEELTIGMVSYSMTHHTRQSALGLPFIQDKKYKGEQYQVSEYTMSEILSTIYDVVEEDGVSEGILFLDEINCVSETLAPSMLQFLQFKTFGKHKIPDGWVVVTAGNPPEYNDSVREFDIVTWDRLKRIDVEADFQTWANYAKISGVHPAILSYLELKQYDFYKVETGVDGKSFVTARGWVDLSKMMRLFEEKEFPIDENLIAQYLQDVKVAKNFSIYYDLFCKYRTAYKVEEILDGTYSETIVEQAKNAPFDEQFALISLIIETLTNSIREVSRYETLGFNFVKESMILKSTKTLEEVSSYVEKLEENLRKKRHANSISQEDVLGKQKVIQEFHKMVEVFKKDKGTVEVEKYGKKFYLDHKKYLKKELDRVQKEIEHTLEYSNKAFGESQSFFIVLSELTTDPICANFLSKNGGDTYFKYNKNLLIHDNQKEILHDIRVLEDSES
ncbi:MAG: AAA family ATPase [Eubacteriales bacterium]